LKILFKVCARNVDIYKMIIMNGQLQTTDIFNISFLENNYHFENIISIIHEVRN